MIFPGRKVGVVDKIRYGFVEQSTENPPCRQPPLVQNLRNNNYNLRSSIVAFRKRKLLEKESFLYLSQNPHHLYILEKVSDFV